MLPYYIPKGLGLKVSYSNRLSGSNLNVAEGGFIVKITEPGFIANGLYEKIYLHPDTLIFWGYHLILDQNKVIDRFKFYSEHPTRVDKTLGLLFRNHIEYGQAKKGKAQGFFILNQEHEDFWIATINLVLTC
jgi:hypothetical protein